MNKYERRLKGQYKHRNHLNLLISRWGNSIPSDHYIYKTTRTPCSCNMCNRNLYESDKQKELRKMHEKEIRLEI